MDIRQRFITEITGAAPPGAAPPAPPLSTAELKKEQAACADLYAAGPASGMDPALRRQLQSRVSPLWTELLKLGAEGLRASPAFAQRHGAPPQVCDETVAQDGAVSQLIKGAGDLHDAATAAAAEAARDGRARALAVMGAAQGVIAGSSAPAGSAAPAGSSAPADAEAAAQAELCFAEAFRLYEEGAAPGEAAALRRQRRVRPLHEARDRTRDEAAQLRLIDRYLSETGNGRRGGSDE